MDVKKDGPDQYSHEWYLQQLRGITHMQRLLAANQEDQGTNVSALLKRVDALEAGRAQDMAKIGELIGRLDQAAKEFSALSRKFDELKGNAKKVA